MQPQSLFQNKRVVVGGLVVFFVLVLLWSAAPPAPMDKKGNQEPSLAVDREGNGCYNGKMINSKCYCENGFTGKNCAEAVYVSYQAPTKHEADECTEFVSQVGQDYFLYHNFWKGRPKGVYVDVGANEPKDDSNTWLLDKCLGWKGICVEVNPTMAEKIRSERSCIVENVCISDIVEKKRFRGKHARLVGAVPISTPLSDDVFEIDCMPLHKILEKHNLKEVDFVSLDIDGFEMATMSKYFSSPESKEIDLKLMLIETFWMDNNFIELMTDYGYRILTDLGVIDHVFIKSTTNSPTLQYHPKQREYRDHNQEFLKRVQKDKQNCLKGAF